MEAKKNTKKEFQKNFRRSGDPLRVEICRIDDPEAGYFIRMAKACGHVAYQKDGRIFVDVLAHHNFFRAEDAVFSPVEDGTTYVFKDSA